MYKLTEEQLARVESKAMLRALAQDRGIMLRSDNREEMRAQILEEQSADLEEAPVETGAPEAEAVNEEEVGSEEEEEGDEVYGEDEED